MKEDITILTAFLLSNIPEIITQEEFDEVKQALENLIKVYRELEERNSILNESNNLKINKINELEKENQSYRDYLGEPPCYDNAKYIPKSKVKEKIKELYEDKDNKYYDMFLEQRDIEKTISILQELTEDK